MWSRLLLTRASALSHTDVWSHCLCWMNVFWLDTRLLSLLIHLCISTIYHFISLCCDCFHMLGPRASWSPHRTAVSVSWYGGSRASIMGLGSQESHWMHQWRGHGSPSDERMGGWVADWGNNAKTVRGAVGGEGVHAGWNWGKKGIWADTSLGLPDADERSLDHGMYRTDASSYRAPHMCKHPIHTPACA